MEEEKVIDVIEHDKEFHFICPKCKLSIQIHKFCPECGQKLNWESIAKHFGVSFLPS